MIIFKVIAFLLTPHCIFFSLYSIYDTIYDTTFMILKWDSTKQLKTMAGQHCLWFVKPSFIDINDLNWCLPVLFFFSGKMVSYKLSDDGWRVKSVLIGSNHCTKTLDPKDLFYVLKAWCHSNCIPQDTTDILVNI